ncbi:hypothetical protein MJT46_016946 [Ovis ammon polii x Ovis aries]|nr:hypothetical protein MJT46_016946 [Ovis ammon polii x Ovis aries]
MGCHWTGNSLLNKASPMPFLAANKGPAAAVTVTRPLTRNRTLWGCCPADPSSLPPDHPSAVSPGTCVWAPGSSVIGSPARAWRWLLARVPVSAAPASEMMAHPWLPHRGAQLPSPPPARIRLAWLLFYEEPRPDGKLSELIYSHNEVS